MNFLKWDKAGRRCYPLCPKGYGSSPDQSLSAIVGDSIPMELGHLTYRRHTFEDYVGVRGRKWLGQKKWERAVRDVIARLIAAREPQAVVGAGGNVKNLKNLPPGCRTGDNLNAFMGGFRVWEKTYRANRSTSRKHRRCRDQQTRN